MATIIDLQNDLNTLKPLIDAYNNAVITATASASKSAADAAALQAAKVAMDGQLAKLEADVSSMVVA